MRRLIFLSLFVIAIVGWLGFYFIFKRSAPAGEEAVAGPLAVERSSNGFTRSMQEVMDNYYSMTAAFVQEDSTKVNAAALSLALSFDSIALQELKADTSIIDLTTNLITGVKSTLLEIPGKKSWDEKRSLLQSSSDMLYDLLRTVQYNGGKVYQQFCPMAFDHTGANWLSNTTEIRNPYFGEKMLECGETKDSLQF